MEETIKELHETFKAGKMTGEFKIIDGFQFVMMNGWLFSPINVIKDIDIKYDYNSKYWLELSNDSVLMLERMKVEFEIFDGNKLIKKCVITKIL